jgi:hypothetical protein
MDILSCIHVSALYVSCKMFGFVPLAPAMWLFPLVLITTAYGVSMEINTENQSTSLEFPEPSIFYVVVINVDHYQGL